MLYVWVLKNDFENPHTSLEYLNNMFKLTFSSLEVLKKIKLLNYSKAPGQCLTIFHSRLLSIPDISLLNLHNC